MGKLGKVLQTSLSVLLTASLLTACTATTGTASSEKEETVVGNVSESESKGKEESGINADGRYDKVIVAVNADPADLLPCKPNGNGKPKFFWSIYEALFDYDDDNNLVPSLASGYTEVSDTVWNIKLFEEIYDSEGNHITADDVVYSVNWLIETGNNIKYDCLSLEGKTVGRAA